MFGLGGAEIVSILAVLFFTIIPGIFWIWALVDILKNEFNGSNKVIWLLVVVFIPLIGIICYFTIGRKQKINPNAPALS